MQGALFLDGESSRDSWGWGQHRLTDAGFFIPETVATEVRLSSLRTALMAAVAADVANDGHLGYVDDLERDASLVISTAREDEFDGKHSPPHDVSVDLIVDRLVGCVDLLLQSEDWSAESIQGAVSPLLKEVDASFVDCGESGELPYAGNPWPWAVRFYINPRGRSVGDILGVGLAIRDLLLAADGDSFGAQAAWALMTAGRVQALYGQPESRWLEAKTFGWDVTNDEGKIELAQDIARFANGNDDGVMVVGLETRKEASAEYLIRGPDQHFTAKDAQRHHQVIDARVYPPVQGLRVEVVPSGHDSDLLAFWVPAQPEELKPFLVHGVVIGENIEGAFMSIVRRRGEHSIVDSPETVHAQIAAGRALLRRGYSLVKDKGEASR